MIKRFHVQKAFIGTDGFDIDFGFMGRDLMRCEVAQYMAEASDELIILTDASKFSQKSLVEQVELDQVSQVITDHQILEDKQQFLTQNHIKVTVI